MFPLEQRDRHAPDGRANIYKLKFVRSKNDILDVYEQNSAYDVSLFR